MDPYDDIRKQVLSQLTSRLPVNLFYHSVDHTLDVLDVCEEYITREGLNDYNARMLRFGALFHDLGFTVSLDNHENHSVTLAKKILRDHKITQEEITIIQGLILATRVDQSAVTKLEKILCDADLDYLGRDNYYQISDLLYQELMATGIIQNKKEWYDRQIDFLENHQYYTEYARQHLQPEKNKRLEELKKNIQ